MASIDTFRSEFNGVRTNRFRVSGTLNDASGNQVSPAGGGPNFFEFYCKAASIPGSAIGIIPVGYKGRPVKFSGERTYTDWAVQIYDSSTGNLRELFEDWIDAMDTRDTHEINYNNANSAWTVEYMDMSLGTRSNSDYKRKITLVNCFPVDISPIDLSYDVPDTFAEFTVTLTYDYWKYEPRPT
jgi:hypothetical protein